jgi:4-oxalocrotonate tautomerase
MIRAMPYVNVKVVGKLSKEQKKNISKEISESLLKHAGKPKDHTYIVFDEVAGENWAKGEQLFG